MPETPTYDLGQHTVEFLPDGSVLLASHIESAEIPIRETVQLRQEEAVRLYWALQAMMEPTIR